MLCKLHLFYRTSPFARRQVGNLYTKDVLDFKAFKIKPGFRNRNVEILNAKMKALGAKIDFGFDGIRAKVFDNSVHSYEYKGRIHICTEQEMREFLIEELMRANFNKTKHHGTKKQIEAEYQEFKRIELQKVQGIESIRILDDKE